MKTLFNTALVLTTLSSSVMASTTMSSCIALATEVALEEHFKVFPAKGIPSIEIGRSRLSPTNGIDLSVSVDKKVTYNITAGPDRSGGCAGATIRSVQDL